VEEKTAAPAQQASEYDMVTLTSFLFKVRMALLLALAVPEHRTERQPAKRLERASPQPCHCLQASWRTRGTWGCDRSQSPPTPAGCSAVLQGTHRSRPGAGAPARNPNSLLKTCAEVQALCPNTADKELPGSVAEAPACPGTQLCVGA